MSQNGLNWLSDLNAKIDTHKKGHYETSLKRKGYEANYNFSWSFFYLTYHFEYDFTMLLGYPKYKLKRAFTSSKRFGTILTERGEKSIFSEYLKSSKQATTLLEMLDAKEIAWMGNSLIIQGKCRKSFHKQQKHVVEYADYVANEIVLKNYGL